MKYQPFQPSNFYHLYNRGNNKECIFKNDENYIYFLALVKKYLLPICDIYSYCLLPNHFHFIIRIKDLETLPEKIRNEKSKLHQPFSNLFNAYTKAINKQYKRTGSLFQEHLKRIKISDETYLYNLIVYVNTNSKHHSFSEFENYKYSSYKSLISTKPTLLKRLIVIQLFNDIDNFKFVHNMKKLNIEAIRNYLLE
ncbi:transposase [Lutibacter sp. A80]|uniref:transposase n=1 Tax=Lutibacter sp. A80 TaxID=2918453 RepID=UPI001F06974C|nr:transposase [Lutibacter sp. A80]UMB59725.1 transposase [Lutibacter sp. A80]